MQIHSIASGKFTANGVDEFWRTVDSINWPERQDSMGIREDLIKSISPREAVRLRTIATFYMINLVSVFKTWQTAAGDPQSYDLFALESLASNIVGGGKLNYDEYYNNPKYVKVECANIDISNDFILSLPSDENYYGSL